MIINNKYYSIVKTGIDDYKLTIKASKREIEFKRNINFAKELESGNMKGRLELIKYLLENSLTKEDLIKRKEKVDEQGKIIITYDDSMFRYLEDNFIKETRARIMLQIMTEILGCELDKLIEEMEIEEEKIQDITALFGKDFTKCMLNKFEEETPRTIAKPNTKQ